MSVCSSPGIFGCPPIAGNGESSLQAVQNAIGVWALSVIRSGKLPGGINDWANHPGNWREDHRLISGRTEQTMLALNA
jgi:hypothetical protein